MKKKTRQTLSLQADKIEATLAHHRVTVKVGRVSQGPRWIRFGLDVAFGTTVSSVRARAEEIKLALNAKSVRIVQTEDGLAVDMQRATPRRVDLAELDQDVPREFGTAILGMKGNGDILLVKFWVANVAHILVAGTTGAGKSVLLRSMCLDLARHHTPEQLQMVMIDVKNRPLIPFGDLPHLAEPIIRDPDKAVDMMNRLVALMEERDRLGATITTGGAGEPRILVVIDELADLAMIGGEPFKFAITRLAQRGREAGIHLLAGTQKPSAQLFGGLALANFPLRIVGKVPTTQEAAFAAGIAGSGAESLSGTGDFVAIQGGNPVMFQGAYVSTKRILDEVERINKQSPAVTLVSFPVPVTQPDPEPLADEQLTKYVDQVRELWPELIQDGEMRRGLKADIAEILFGERDTAGHKGKWVTRVVSELKEDTPPGDILDKDAIGGGEEDWPRAPVRVYDLRLRIAKFGPHSDDDGNVGGMAWRIELNGPSGSQDLPLPLSWVARSTSTFHRAFAFLGLE